LSLEQAQHEAQAASQELERISMQREQVAQSIRGIGQAVTVQVML
jgi:chaperonin cofactor prefoldin